MGTTKMCAGFEKVLSASMAATAAYSCAAGPSQNAPAPRVETTSDAGADSSTNTGASSGGPGTSSGAYWGASSSGSPSPPGSSSSASSSSSSGTTSSSGASGTDAEADDGVEGSAGCPGVPIVPDANGYVAPGSNSVGIHGSFFMYSDCNDLHGQNCANVTSPTGSGAFPNVGGKICTSGTNSAASNAWGAGIGFELNDGPPQQPYDTTAHHVVGFCFVLSGSTIPSTSVRVAFPTQDNNDNAYFEAVSTPGQHTVSFSDIEQGSWVKTPSPWEPTKVMLVQFQIPAAVGTPVPWDFCIDGLTAVVQ